MGQKGEFKGIPRAGPARKSVVGEGREGGVREDNIVYSFVYSSSKHALVYMCPVLGIKLWCACILVRESLDNQ